MSENIIMEVERCLHCKQPLCRTGCPINTDIPGFIAKLKANRLNEAGQILFDNNPLSLVCSMVCNHQEQCEGHCIRGIKSTPVHISSIEQYISDTYLDKVEFTCAPQNGMFVAVIGAGPAGITISIELARKGYAVTIFDSNDHIGGVLQYGIPGFRLPKTVLERYRSLLLKMGVRIRPGTTIGGALEIQNLFRDGYKSIFIGTGVWRPQTLGIKGESLGNVHFGINYLANPAVFNLGDTISIIGMGNTAMDVARTALRNGCRDVTLYARKQQPSANREECEYARLDGAKFEFGMIPVEITPEGVIFNRILFGTDGTATGVSEEKILMKSDSVLICASQRPKNKLVQTTPGLQATDRGFLRTDGDGHTTCEGIFASGDVVLGARTVVEAVADSRKVACVMDRYMKGISGNSV